MKWFSIVGLTLVASGDGIISLDKTESFDAYDGVEVLLCPPAFLKPYFFAKNAPESRFCKFLPYGQVRGLPDCPWYETKCKVGAEIQGGYHARDEACVGALPRDLLLEFGGSREMIAN